VLLDDRSTMRLEVIAGAANTGRDVVFRLVTESAAGRSLVALDA
jgi:hypothetical protein